MTLTSPVLLNSNSVAATSNSVDHQGQRQGKKRRREKHHRYSPDPQGMSPSKEHKRKRKRKSLDMENPNQQETPRIKIKVLLKSVLGYQILLKQQHFKISLPYLPSEKEKVGFWGHWLVCVSPYFSFWSSWPIFKKLDCEHYVFGLCPNITLFNFLH